ncbi:MAG: ankyrin repeat domain-containing protein, partial [Verrucomicrobiales bacterium]|nr:ankyrin repeat domain-containing protein [Verrucomicrobiales bacterium]
MWGVAVTRTADSQSTISIWDAAADGNTEAVKQHLAAGVDVNAKDNIRLTPLHSAAGQGHKVVAELLIDKGADVNAAGGLFGSTPLHKAAEEGRKEVVELLISKGADLEANRYFGKTPLHWAAYKGHKEI